MKKLRRETQKNNITPTYKGNDRSGTLKPKGKIKHAQSTNQKSTSTIYWKKIKEAEADNLNKGTIHEP